MAYVLQLPDNIIINGNTFPNGYVRIGSASLICTVGVQLYDDVRSIIIRGPDFINASTRPTGTTAGMKSDILSQLVKKIKSWRDQNLKELQAQDALQNALQTLKTELGI